MCLQVHPNGERDGASTHVSIFNCIMQGPFDAHLKWPFRGNITNQILNQMENGNHVERTVNYTDTDDITCRRVTDRERSLGRGHSKFLPHNSLGLDTARNTQYLQHDMLYIRVLKVTCKS